MIRFKKAQRADMPIITEYEIKREASSQTNNLEKLNHIAKTNKAVANNYQDFYIISYYFKTIGCYSIKAQKLKSIYLIDKYQKLENKVLRKINKLLERNQENE